MTVINMPQPSWQHLPHDADMGVRGMGATAAQAFEQAALAMTAIVSDVQNIADRDAVTIDCHAPDLELLLVDWLNALIYEMATRKMLFSHFEVTIEDTHLQGTAWGEPIDRVKHQPSVEIKGATYTDLKVYQRKDGVWTAQCVVDV